MNTLPRFLLYAVALAFFTLLALGLPVRSQEVAVPAAESRFWRETVGYGLAAEAPADAPLLYRTLVAVEEQLDAALALAPHEYSAYAWERAALLDLPLPDGNLASFAFVASPVMAPELAARYPALTTYLGRQQDDPTVLARLTRSPQGYHALVLQPHGSFYLAPYAHADRAVHMVYATSAAATGALERDAPLVPAALAEPLAQMSGAYGGNLRTFRFAAAATGEFTQASGGTKADALAQIVQVLNAINAIYERDLSVRLELIANTDELIYTNPETDPFPANDRYGMLGANQQTVDAVIGPDNYDVGHLFSTTSGGLATLNSVCKDGIKANGTSGTGPTIRIDTMVGTTAHELGHQFGADHSFNSVAGFCQYGRSAQAAYEPGSGSTIMAYAGTCAPENLQDHEDLVFHIHSLIEMSAHLSEVDGCGLTTPLGNRPPVVSAGPNYTIPANTPFELIGSASDPDGDTLSFSWEQYDLGAASPPLSDDGGRPLFRSFMPGPSPARTFPQVADILSGQATVGETLPNTNRQLNFRFVARDNHPGAGAFAYDTTTLTVSTQAGPFRVTAPAGGERVDPGATLEVRWDVAGTNLAPVSCANVQIELSRDGGQSFPTMLAASTPNDGQHTVTLPQQGAVAAHVRVKCSDNVFLHISPRFSIGGGVSKFSDSSDGLCDEDCSLREAVQLANAAPGPDTIMLEAGTYSLSLTGSWPDGGALEVSDDLTITGVGAGRTIIDANQLDRLFKLTNSATLTLTNLTLRNGRAPGPGGAIFSDDGRIVLQDMLITDNEALWKGGAVALEGGSLVIERSTLRDNRARYDAATIEQYGTMSGGGAIWQSGGALQITASTISDNAITGVPTASEVRPDGGAIYFWNFREGEGQVRIAMSTLSGNSAGSAGMGGAIFFLPFVGSMELVNTTVSGNSANVGGALALFGTSTAPVMLDFVTISANSASFVGGIYAGSGSTTLRNTILAQNGTRNCHGADSLSSAGFNLFGDTNCPVGANDLQGNPYLAALGDNGGSTLTHALLAESPALNAAGATCPATDQRGQPRPLDNRCDIGAFEGRSSDPFVTATPTPTRSPGQAATPTPTRSPGQAATPTPTRSPGQAATATPTRSPTSSQMVYLPLVRR